VHKLIRVLNEELYAGQSEKMQDINDVFVEEKWSWSVVRVEPPSKQDKRTLVLVFRWKEREYWLAWAGVVEDWSKKSLASVLDQVKPGLELPPKPKPVEIVPPSSIAPIDEISEMESLESLKAGYNWQVQLAFGQVKQLSPLKLLYCRAQWHDQDSVPRAIPFMRYGARHLGPVIWTFSRNGFRDSAPDLNSRPSVPMSLQSDSCIYAASLPLSGFTEGYVQVYSAFDGRELVRETIKPGDSSLWPWGLFMSDKKFGVCADFESASPGMPAFSPIDSLSAKPKQGKEISIKLSLKNDLFVLKAGKRILPTRGQRLLARWWLNDKPVLPEATGEYSFAGKRDTEALASLLRLPARLPVSRLKAKPGDKISLQLMLCPDRIKSPLRNNVNRQNIVCLDHVDLPAVALLSNRINFKANTKMLAQVKPKAVTAASFKKLTDAIEQQDITKVKKMVSANPQLVNFRGRSGQTALEFLCRARPEVKHILWFRIGGEITIQYWKHMSEIAGILIDYGAEVNAKTKSGQMSPLQGLLDSEKYHGRPENTLPVELVRLFLDRGTDLEAVNTDGTALQQAVSAVQSHRAPRMIPIVEILLEYGADVFAVHEPWAEESVFDQIGHIKKQGHVELAALISNYSKDRHKALEKAVHLGVEEFLASIRNAGEKGLSSLKNELPWEEGMDLVVLGRQFQRELGSSLEGLGGIEKLALKGNWAEALLPTGRQGDNANLHIVLMRYPGGDYHAMRASLTESRKMGRSIRNARSSYGELKNAVYSVFEQIDIKRISGGRRTGYPKRFDRLSIKTERGRLVIQGVDLPSWRYFHAEIASDVVYYWDDIWQLNLSRKATFATGARQLVMADGVMTVGNADSKVEFDVSGDEVRMKTNDTQKLGSEFILELDTLEVKQGDGTD
jgi:hypothetical protein